MFTAKRLRQLAAVLVSIYGVLTAAVPGMRLPVAVSVVLTAVGPAMVLLEHWLADPSTGTPTTPPATSNVTFTYPPTNVGPGTLKPPPPP